MKNHNKSDFSLVLVVGGAVLSATCMWLGCYCTPLIIAGGVVPGEGKVNTPSVGGSELFCSSLFSGKVVGFVADPLFCCCCSSSTCSFKTWL